MPPVRWGHNESRRSATHPLSYGRRADIHPDLQNSSIRFLISGVRYQRDPVPLRGHGSGRCVPGMFPGLDS